ncbi:MAG: DMT family transporter [Chitinophagaceae bacterium]|nr:MAG: DMT family transporter [Chitinophagaceae bacterium]
MSLMTFAFVDMNYKIINWLLFILLCFIWGSSFILMKVSIEGLTGPQIAALRIFSAGLVCIPFAFFHLRHIPKTKLGLVFLAGVFGNVIPAFCYAIALMHLDSSVAGILNSLTPLCVVTIGAVFFGSKVRAQKLIGVIIGFAGLVLLTVTQKNISVDNLEYAGLILFATLSYGLNVNQVGHFLQGVKPIHIATVSLAFMTLPTGLILWQTGYFDLDFSSHIVQWASLNTIMLGIVGSSIATVLFYMLVQRASGLFASLVTYGIPFVAIFWGIIYGETITLVAIACLLLILAGVYLANRPEKK